MFLVFVETSFDCPLSYSMYVYDIISIYEFDSAKKMDVVLHSSIASYRSDEREFGVPWGCPFNIPSILCLKSVLAL